MRGETAAAAYSRVTATSSTLLASLPAVTPTGRHRTATTYRRPASTPPTSMVRAPPTAIEPRPPHRRALLPFPAVQSPSASSGAAHDGRDRPDTAYRRPASRAPSPSVRLPAARAPWPPYTPTRRIAVRRAGLRRHSSRLHAARAAPSLARCPLPPRPHTTPHSSSAVVVHAARRAAGTERRRRGRATAAALPSVRAGRWCAGPRRGMPRVRGACRCGPERAAATLVPSPMESALRGRFEPSRRGHSTSGGGDGYPGDYEEF